MITAFTGTALAVPVHDSGDKVEADTTQLNWTGNGLPITPECGDAADFGAGGAKNGATKDNYLLWIFTTDGGDVTGSPTLTINGTTYGNAFFTGGTWQIVTPGFDLAYPADSAFTTFVVNSPGGGAWVLTISHGCPNEQEVFDATLATQVHDPDHTDVTGGSVDLGTKIHDLATVTPGSTNTSDVASGSVDFTLFHGNGCVAGENDGNIIDTESVGLGTDNSGDETSFDANLQATSTPRALAAGDYSFGVSATLTSSLGTTISVDADECESFTVNQSTTTLVTEVHDANHNDITNGTVHVGDYVHDKAIIDTGLVDGFDPTGNVRFRFFANGTCSGTTYTQELVAIGSDGTAESTPILLVAPGSYSYLVRYLGDSNYTYSEAACEPFTVVPRAFGKTMGFWGNVNGQKVLSDNNAFSGANAVTLGINTSGRCFVVVDSATKSLKILPNTLNGMSILTNCTTTANLDSGINGNSMNVLLAQTLAISYNIKYVTNYAGQTIQGLGCTAVSPLTSASTVQQVRDYANQLIGNAIKNNGSSTVTQSQIGAMNTLLGCLNRES